MPVTTVTLQPAEASAFDSYMDQDNATTNYGTNALLKVGTFGISSHIYTSALKFALTTIPASASILSATMSLYIAADNASGAQSVYAYRCLRDWVEAQVTYNIYSTGNNWTSGGGLGSGTDYTTTGGALCAFTATQVNGDEKQWNLKTLVEGWVSGANANYGVLLIQVAGTADYWDLHSSSSATAGYYPKLTVTYATPGGSGWW
jgi:hypothetical protein